MKLGNLRNTYPSIPWIALTATAPKKVQDDLIKSLALKGPVATFKVSSFRSNLYYDIAFKNLMNDDFIELKAYIEKCLKTDEDTENLSSSQKPCGIIYCRKIETTESVARSLTKLGLRCAAYNSKLKKSDKEQVQNDWMNGVIPVIAATVSFGMGIDKGPVRFVVHWGISQSISEWYQESGRAGRDGKLSFCRSYYDRDEVRSITFLLRMEVNNSKDKNNDQLEKAKLAMKEFEKIVDHCESVNCRHRLFSTFFGDDPPKCNNMCDACKNKKESTKNLEKFQKLTASASLGSMTKVVDMDPTDLYGGGRSNLNDQKSSFENHDNESDSGPSFRKASEMLDRKEERAFIEKQFALRKAQAAEAMQMQPSAQLSRVKAALSTEKKVQGLTIKARDTSFGHIADCLKQNVEKAGKLTPPETPTHALVYADFEEIAKEIEYGCFSSCKAVSIYRRNIAFTIAGIKKSPGLCGEILDFTPSKRQAFGGDYKTIVKDLKSRYGADVVDELEGEKHKKTERVKKDKFKQSGRDGMNQMRINSFFSSNPKKSPDDSSDTSVDTVELDKQEIEKVLKVKEETEVADNSTQSSNDSELDRLNEIKENLKKELEKTELQDSPDKKPAIEVIEVNDSIEDDDAEECALVIDDGTSDCSKEKSSIPVRRSVIDKGDGFAIELMKRKESPASSFTPAKRPRHEAPAKSTNKVDPAKAKNDISKIVVEELNPFYKTGKFKSNEPKQLFKIMAKTLTHKFCSQSESIPSRRDIKNHIHEIFYNKGAIRIVEDFQ